MKYDLLTEHWIPALDLQGRPVTFGLLELFERAHELKTLVLETPDVTAGMYRLLLAILHRSYDGPRDLKKEWRAIWNARRFDRKRVEKYLGQWRDRFDLWDESHPFLQDPTIPSSEPESVSRLFVERAQGNNPTLFDHTLDDDRLVVDAASAARRLVGSQVMALGGRIPGSAASAVASPFASTVTFLVLGETVFETLVLNLLVCDGQAQPIPSSATDSPAWERAFASANGREPDGHLDLMTWRPRRYRLIPADASGTTVSGVIPAGEADRLEADEFRDPFAGYRASESVGWLPLRVDPDRALWRDSLPFFARDGEAGRAPVNVTQTATLVADGVIPRAQLLRVMTVGFATERGKAKKRLGRIETLPIPATLLAKPMVIPSIQQAIAQATAVDGAANSAAFTSARHSLSAGERVPDTNEVSGLAYSTGCRAVFWSEAGAAFSGFLLDLANDRVDAGDRWEESLRKAAFRAFKCVELKLGASGRGFKALTMGRQTLMRRLHEVFPEPQSQEVTPQ